jgi:hypothetical protein
MKGIWFYCSILDLKRIKTELKIRNLSGQIKFWVLPYELTFLRCHSIVNCRAATKNEDAFKARIATGFQESGLRTIFAEDIVKLINLADLDQDFDFIRKVLVECARYIVMGFKESDYLELLFCCLTEILFHK